MLEDVTPAAESNLNNMLLLPKTKTDIQKIEGDADSYKNTNSPSMTLEKRLEMWIKARCLEQDTPSPSFIQLNHIFREVYNDKRFWRYRTKDNDAYFEEALSLMWRYFLRNLCTATTAKTNVSFLDTRDVAVGRLLKSLQGNLKNLQKRRNQEHLRHEHRIDVDGRPIDPQDYLPDTQPNLAQLQYDALIHLLETDPTGELKKEKYTLKGLKKTSQKPYLLTAQDYLLMRYRQDMSIREIAKTLDIPVGSLTGGTKQRRWKELEQRFAQQAINSVAEGSHHDPE